MKKGNKKPQLIALDDDSSDSNQELNLLNSVLKNSKAVNPEERAPTKKPVKQSIEEEKDEVS